MDSAVEKVMYYLAYILAVFGLIFMLILLVRLTLWCLMCNLKQEKERRITRLKLKALKKAEEGNGIPNPPTLRRSPNVQRLNLIKPEDDKKFSDTLKSQTSASSSSSSELAPPTPPPKDIEPADEAVQQAANQQPVYATLAFPAPKRKAPSPPPQRVSCICPFCSSVNKAKLNPEHEQQQAADQDDDDEIEVIACEETGEAQSQVTQELPVDTVPETNDAPESVASGDAVVVIIEQQHAQAAVDMPQEDELPPLPQTPEAPASLNGSVRSLAHSTGTQSALDSLDQAIEELDDVVQDLKTVEVENNPTDVAEETPETLEPVVEATESEEPIKDISTNAADEPEIVLEPISEPIAESTNESEPDIVAQEEIAEPQAEQTNEPKEDIIVEEQIIEKPDPAEAAIGEEIKENGTSVEQSPNNESENITAQESVEPAEPETVPEETKSNSIENHETPKETSAAIAEPIKEEEEPKEELPFYGKPSEIKKRESLRRQKSGPRVVESVAKPKPSVPYKPIKLARTISAPVNGSNGEPQCAIYARVIDQIKKRNQESTSPEPTVELAAPTEVTQESP